jgi:hypothetical protein
VAVVGLIVSGVVAAGFAAWVSSPTPLTIGPDVISTIVIAAAVLFALSLIALFFGVTLAIASELGVRYVVLSDRGAMDSLRQGWRDLWAGRGAFKMFLIQLGIGILYAIVVGIVAAVLTGPMLVVSSLGIRVDQPAGAGLGILLLVPAAIYAAFYHATWTVFFRRMTAMAPAFAPVPVPVPEPMPSDV